MANETKLTLIGNLTADPELRYTQSGHAVASFTIASTPRSYDKQSGSWQDGNPLFLRCSVWRDYAEHVASSLSKGMQVIAQGRLVQRSFETEQGEKRTVFELEVEEIGPTLRFATAQVTKAGANTSGSGWAAAGASNSTPVSPSQGQASWTAQQPPQADYSDHPPF